MGVQGIDREQAASLELELAGAAGALTRAAAEVADAMRCADVCDDTSGRIRRVVAWLDDAKRDLERRAYLIDIPDGTYGPYLPSMLVLAGPPLPSADPLDDLFAGAADRYAMAGPVNWSIDGLPETVDPKLYNILKALYRPWTPESIGNGSTADAIRYEIETGAKVGEHYHLEKAINELRGLIKIYTNPGSDPGDQDEALRAIDEVVAAMRSGVHPDATRLLNHPDFGDDLRWILDEGATSEATPSVEAATAVAESSTSLPEVVASEAENIAEDVGGFVEGAGSIIEEGLEGLSGLL